VPVLGIDARRYLEQLLPLCAGSISRVGRLRLVPVDVALAALERLAAADVPPPLAQTDGDDDADDPLTADDVLGRLGRRRAP
jgi:hypothetical protein